MDSYQEFPTPARFSIVVKNEDASTTIKYPVYRKRFLNTARVFIKNIVYEGGGIFYAISARNQEFAEQIRQTLTSYAETCPRVWNVLPGAPVIVRHGGELIRGSVYHMMNENIVHVFAIDQGTTVAVQTGQTLAIPVASPLLAIAPQAVRFALVGLHPRVSHESVARMVHSSRHQELFIEIVGIHEDADGYGAVMARLYLCPPRGADKVDLGALLIEGAFDAARPLDRHAHVPEEEE